MTQKKIYIAGKVTKEPVAECTMKFGKVQKELEAQGYEVVNPLEVVDNFKAKWDDAMRACIKALMNCDEIYMLKDWKESNGAKIEHALAYNLKMTTHYQQDTQHFKP